MWIVCGNRQRHTGKTQQRRKRPVREDARKNALLELKESLSRRPPCCLGGMRWGQISHTADAVRAKEMSGICYDLGNTDSNRREDARLVENALRLMEASHGGDQSTKAMYAVPVT